MSKKINMFVCNKMYSVICNTNITGQKNCECCLLYFDKCHNCSYKYTPVCKNCTHQKNEVEVK